jgi:DNA-binding SARP family transcriptional activator
MRTSPHAPRGRGSARFPTTSGCPPESKVMTIGTDALKGPGGMVQTHRTNMELWLLRGFELRWQGEPINIPVSSRRLLAFLALHDRPLHRPYIAGRLWPDTLDVKAAANLRTALWRLRRPRSDLIACDATHLALHGSVWVDVHALEGLAHRLLHDASGIDLAAIDPHAWTGELLPDLWDSWLVFERERLRQVSLHALEALCRRCLDAGHIAEAVLAGVATVETEPLRESANQLLIEAHLAERNQSEAVRHYERYRELLRSELRLEPSPQLSALIEAREALTVP